MVIGWSFDSGGSGGSGCLLCDVFVWLNAVICCGMVRMMWMPLTCRDLGEASDTCFCTLAAEAFSAEAGCACGRVVVGCGSCAGGCFWFVDRWCSVITVSSCRVAVCSCRMAFVRTAEM